MPFMRVIQRRGSNSAVGAALLVLAAGTTPGAAQTVAVIELVPLSAASLSDTTTTLPAPLNEVDPGVTFVVEVWARTDDSRGLSSVSATLQFDPAIASVNSVTHTQLFSELTSGVVDNTAGLVTGLSGSHLSSCVDQVGFTPTWARVAILNMQADGTGSLLIESGDTGSPALGTAVCGLGDLLPAQIAYGTATLTITGPPIPTVSQWGLVILALLLTSVATVLISRRASSIEAA